jgi:hypothetical protein
LLASQTKDQLLLLLLACMGLQLLAQRVVLPRQQLSHLLLLVLRCAVVGFGKKRGPNSQ